MESVKFFAGAILGGGFFAFAQFLIERQDKKKVSGNLRLTRLELMTLMSDYPEKANEILTLAYEYFITMKGNSYMHELFEDYLKKMNLSKPEWYR